MNNEEKLKFIHKMIDEINESKKLQCYAGIITLIYRDDGEDNVLPHTLLSKVGGAEGSTLGITGFETLDQIYMYLRGIKYALNI